jgi:hypothetical protein
MKAAGLSAKASALLLALGSFMTSAICIGALAPQQKLDTAEVARWEALTEQIEDSLPANSCPGREPNIGIVNAANFGGDSVALVDYCPGGAYTDWIIAMRLEAEQPVLAKFRKNGKAISMDFASGSSVKHSADVELVPQRRAIYDKHCESRNGERFSCVVNAYVWNSKLKTFDWDGPLSAQATRPLK